MKVHTVPSSDLILTAVAFERRFRRFICVASLLFSMTAASGNGLAQTPTLGIVPEPSLGPEATHVSAPVTVTTDSDNPIQPGPLPAPLAPAVQTAIEGINFDEDAANNLGTYHIPPDPIGAVGPDHLVSINNTSIEWHTKAGVQQNSQRLGKAGGSVVGSFFAPLSPVNNTFDPKVIYDQYNARFVAVTLEQQDTNDGDPVNDARILIAVSDDDDPNGIWYYQAINGKLNIGGDDTWADYPGLAVSSAAVYITNNMFTFGATRTFKGSRLWIIDKASLYSGGVSAVTVHDPSTAAGLPGQSFTLQPAHMFGTEPGTTGTFLVGGGWFSGSTDLLAVIRVTNPLGVVGFTNTFISMGDVDDFSDPDAPQSGTATLIETNDNRTLNAVWRNDSLYTCLTVVPPSGPDAGQKTAHWVQMNANALTVSLADQGSIGGEDIAPGTYTFFPSIAVNGSGEVAIGFSASAPTIFPGAYYTVRRATDPAGTVDPSEVIAVGQDYYIRTFNGTRNRWGDYSGMAVDPADDRTFCGFNEYALPRGTSFGGEDGRWGTRWGCFSLAVPCDTNDDGDVDSADLVDFVTCSQGPEVPHAVLPVCDELDFDDDTDVDSDDFGICQRCISGSGNPGDPNCAQ